MCVCRRNCWHNHFAYRNMSFHPVMGLTEHVLCCSLSLVAHCKEFIVFLSYCDSKFGPIATDTALSIVSSHVHFSSTNKCPLIDLSLSPSHSFSEWKQTRFLNAIIDPGIKQALVCHAIESHVRHVKGVPSYRMRVIKKVTKR